MQMVWAVGNLGKDPEEKLTSSGKAIVVFPVAVSEKRRGEEVTTWYNCSVMGPQMAYVQKYLRKGSRILFFGKLEISRYTDREGALRTSVNVRVSEVKNLSSRQEDESLTEAFPGSESGALQPPAEALESEGTASGGAARPFSPQAQQGFTQVSEDESDLPF